ncbi:hypothetical protein DFQ30_002321 [Apophysomyces sp. BC1015]|nr:hypothetical protein DFQ30_002321 [Apophysomyces sp. BC1015]KAG0179974.1 hypothetical protein DFQ29_001419 [Apophysomyces sp. BC1021]
MPQFTLVDKRPSFVNFPIPFDHPYTLPTLVVTVSASSLLYYYLQASHTAELREAVRLRDIRNRRHSKRPEDRYASLKVERRFVNPFSEWREVRWWETIFFWLCRWKGNGVPVSHEILEKALPVKKPALDRIFAKGELTDSWVNVEDQPKNRSPVTFTWLGQSTCLITVDGLTILTDPVFSNCSINDHFGPRRLRPLPCSLQDIQHKLDVVLVSHDHFDHLDSQVVAQLGNSVTWYIPLGLRDWFVKRGVENVVELDWWQEIHHKERPEIVFACVPAMHWSGSRTLFDKNGSLWCSYVIKTRHDRVFFCGDTGYSPGLFKAIGELYAPFTLAAIPIGSFEPETLMKHLHMGPVDAVQAHHDLGNPQLSVGIHWGTFMMSDEHYLDPPRVLKQAWEEAAKTASSSNESSNQDSRFITTSLGETMFLQDEGWSV